MFKKYSLLALVMSAAVAALTVIATPAAAATIDVFPGDSIQAAVDAAAPGDVIVVHAGIYREEISITTDGITLQGSGPSATGTVLMPPEAFDGRCGETGYREGTAGICLRGSLSADGLVSDVTIDGFAIVGFPSFGVEAETTSNVVMSDILAAHNGVYGLAAFDSTGISMLNNVVTGSYDAGLYIGESPAANAVVTGNVVVGNGEIGIALRDSVGGIVQDNVVEENCSGILLFDTPIKGAARGWTLQGNQVNGNSELCGPRANRWSGIGIALFGADENLVTGNTLHYNVAGNGSVPFHGGLIVAAWSAKKVSDGNTVTGNDLCRNHPNFIWDGTGEGNVLDDNVCHAA